MHKPELYMVKTGRGMWEGHVGWACGRTHVVP